MFDRLIESESRHPDLASRKRYFLVSTLLVGSMFLTAVVLSLYAADFDIGVGDFEVTRLIAPVAPDVPEPPRQEEMRSQPEDRSSTTQRVIRTDHFARMDEHQKIPTSISVVPSTVKARPRTEYDIGRFDVDPPGPLATRNGPGHSPGNVTRGTDDGTGIRRPQPSQREAEPPPPPVRKLPMQSRGVVNGEAIHLPKPPYPRPAQMVGADGDVQVQVTIDEAGKVISARAISGHPLLRNVAVSAARSARFNPTTLSDQPVKVTGIIVYKFTRP